MTWNYRIVKHRWDDHIEDKTTETYKKLAESDTYPRNDYYSLHEAYYTKEGELCDFTQEAAKISAYWDSPDELISVLETALKDAKKWKDDVIDYDCELADWDDKEKE